MIASHYAEPAKRRLLADTELRSAPGGNSEVLGDCPAGSCFLLLDDSLGWAWGYAGEDKRVGYVKPDVLG